MISRFRAPRLSKSLRRSHVAAACFSQCRPIFRQNEAPSAHQIDYESKYAEKLQKRAQEQGTSLEELKERLKTLERKRRAEKLATHSSPEASEKATTEKKQATIVSASPLENSRKDSSPVKPLASIFNIERLLEDPHDADKISALWRAYHTSRSGGTGRGYLCASIPIATYEKMAGIAKRYPNFILPLPRIGAETGVSDEEKAHEFYFMEWAFHEAPAEPSTLKDPFQKPQPSSNPQVSTILFTPLQEYKMRGSFATPYLVLTNYTDLARSHGLVLMRGEITPSAAGTPGSTSGENKDGRYLLGQQDAQLLAMALQRFYLWSETQGEASDLLKKFHEQPAEFKWEDLLKHTDY